MLRRHCLVLALILTAAVTGPAAEKRSIFPPGVKPVGPYSPGIVAGDYIYLSGQGARGPDGKIPAAFEDQVRQCLENLRSVLKAAGLTMEHVVYTQAYLTDMEKVGKMNGIWRQVFPKAPPAGSVMGVYRLPDETPVEISAVAVRDLAQKRIVNPRDYTADASVSAGVMAGGRLYFSGFLGQDVKGYVPEDPAEQVQLAFERMKRTLAAAGMDFPNEVFVQPYLTSGMPANVMNRIYAAHFEFGNTPARNTMQVTSLPYGAKIEFTGVAIADLAKRRSIRPKNMAPSPTASPCVLADDTLYCSGKSGFIPGPQLGIYASGVAEQLRQVMRNLLDGLEQAGMDFSSVVATNVYLDNIHDFTSMNRVYAQYFPGAAPARTTIQHVVPVERKADDNGRWPALVEIALVAVK